MKKILFLALCSIHFIFIEAQKHQFLETPKFNDADLTKQKSALDENAPAEILYKSTHFSIDNNTGLLVKKSFCRVKIYDKDKAEDWLNLEVHLYENGSNRETLSKIKAFTYNLENGTSAATKVDKSSKYKSKESKYVSITKFAFPNVKNGSVIEYQYEISSPFLFIVPEILIESDIPSLYTEYVLDNPSNISYNVNYTGSLNPKYREVDERTLYGVSCRTYRFGYENLKGFKTEKFINNDRNYRTKISAELHSTNFRELKLYSSSWEQIKQRLYENEDFGGELKKTKLAKENMPAGISGLTDEIAKANAIFNYVKNTFTWNKDRGLYTEDGIKKMIETKTGNAAEINLFLVMMLREAGIKADPLAISTVSNGIINISSPNVSHMNFVIAAIQTKDGFHLYDATTKQSSMDQLPPRDWNQFGILMAKEKVEQLSMINAKTSFTYLTAEAKINDDGSISGTYSDRDTGTYAMFVKENYDDNADKYKKQYKENFAIDFTGIDSKVLENGDFESTMKFSSENLIDKIGKKMIINPMLFLSKSSNEFDQTEERKYLIDFTSPFTRVKKIVLEIPEGYTIEEMPKNKKIVTDDKEIEYSYMAEQKGRTIEVISTTKILSPNYPKEYYPAFRQIWGVASKQENQVISLVKK
ncbi:transglutaminase-like domain-containing protein [Chryseobacterium sp. SSA4.19]|uniref:transglutaminase-like domain-containing protein n=1 Tax=Chryseobacterium sp. SSA4.19 TaxID=2919915 RepID=UPI001F4E9245|nr:transglutaminase-like domain-containing protein [Chryseobacterium sp. SSA4.19]MCJ8153844.1 transglutaminase-like domain-containing protein [Chryseobacterium sp. SSA4.19]